MLLGICLTFPIFVSELEGLDQAQRFVYGAAHRQVIDGDLPQDALVVDHKQPSGRQIPRLQQRQHLPGVLESLQVSSSPSTRPCCGSDERSRPHLYAIPSSSFSTP